MSSENGKPRHTPPGFYPPPEDIVELGESCRSYALRAVGVELDYAPETLPILDRYVELSRDAVRERPELEALVIRAVGAYFGEVIREAVSGFWCRSGLDAGRWLLGSQLVFLGLNPAGLAAEALAAKEEHGGPSSGLVMSPDDRVRVEDRLAALPPVGEDEYYLLSTRFEVIQLAFETLRREMQQSQTHATRYVPEDYEEE